MCVFGNIFHVLGNGIFNSCFLQVSVFLTNRQIHRMRQKWMDRTIGPGYECNEADQCYLINWRLDRIKPDLKEILDIGKEIIETEKNNLYIPFHYENLFPQFFVNSRHSKHDNSFPLAAFSQVSIFYSGMYFPNIFSSLT